MDRALLESNLIYKVIDNTHHEYFVAMDELERIDGLNQVAKLHNIVKVGTEEDYPELKEALEYYKKIQPVAELVANEKQLEGTAAEIAAEYNMVAIKDELQEKEHNCKMEMRKEAQSDPK